MTEDQWKYWTQANEPSLSEEHYNRILGIDQSTSDEDYDRERSEYQKKRGEMVTHNGMVEENERTISVSA